MARPRLFIFGFGYVAKALCRRLRAAGWSVAGTRRPENLRQRRTADGIRLFAFSRQAGLDPAARGTLSRASHLLVTIPPDEAGDPVAAWLGEEPEILGRKLSFLGYLSTTGVYGDSGGGWVNEDSPLRPATDRARRRLAAERAWRRLAEDHGWPLMVFRLPGIYGPGRSPFDRLVAGTARRIDAGRGHVFSRIHVDDIAQALAAAMAAPAPGKTFNLADDEPAPAHEVVAFAARLLGLAPPPLVRLEEAELSATARSFYAECRRVDARAVKRHYGLSWRFPSFREGLAAILAESGYPSAGPYAPSARRSTAG